jgi:hypothetical protein
MRDSSLLPVRASSHLVQVVRSATRERQHSYATLSERGRARLGTFGQIVFGGTAAGRHLAVRFCAIWRRLACNPRSGTLPSTLQGHLARSIPGLAAANTSEPVLSGKSICQPRCLAHLAAVRARGAAERSMPTWRTPSEQHCESSTHLRMCSNCRSTLALRHATVRS